MIAHHHRPAAPLAEVDRFGSGAYLTDGHSLFRVLRGLPQEPTLRLLEDCRTLDLELVEIEELQAAGVKRIFG